MSTWQYNPVEYQRENHAEVIVNQNGANFNNLLSYSFKGKPGFCYADIQLNPNQRLVTDGNMLLWMDEKINEPETECWGGCMQSFGRSCAGEKCCFNTYTNKDSTLRKISVGFNDPGDLLSFAVTPGNGWILTQNAFVAGTDNLDVTGRCIGCCAALLSSEVGEGLVLTRVKLHENEQGPGIFIAGSYGELVRHDVQQGQVLFVSRGLFFAAHESTKFQIGLAGGLKNCLCTGGGIVMKFYGPCVIYTQSRDPDKWNPEKHRRPNNKHNRAGGGVSH